jgi:hypothetical protein
MRRWIKVYIDPNDGSIQANGVNDNAIFLSMLHKAPLVELLNRTIGIQTLNMWGPQSANFRLCNGTGSPHDFLPAEVALLGLGGEIRGQLLNGFLVQDGRSPAVFIEDFTPPSRFGG